MRMPRPLVGWVRPVPSPVCSLFTLCDGDFGSEYKKKKKKKKKNRLKSLRLHKFGHRRILGIFGAAHVQPVRFTTGTLRVQARPSPCHFSFYFFSLFFSSFVFFSILFMLFFLFDWFLSFYFALFLSFSFSCFPFFSISFSSFVLFWFLFNLLFFSFLEVFFSISFSQFILFPSFLFSFCILLSFSLFL